MISSEFSEDPENNHINSWLECNLMSLGRTMVKIWNKWVLELEHRDGRRDQNIINIPTGCMDSKVTT